MNLKQIFWRNSNRQKIVLALCMLFLSGAFLFCSFGYSNAPRLPGSDHTDKLTAADDLLRIIDSALFSWGARLMAGLCVLGAGWNLKEQRFAIAVVCILAAIVIGTAPMWIQNIFEIGGGTLFS